MAADPTATAARLSKPARGHNPLYAPAVCLCVECSRKVLALRCPVTTINPHMQGGKLQCGNYKGHRGDHTMLVATTFVIAEERVRLDG